MIDAICRRSMPERTNLPLGPAWFADHISEHGRTTGAQHSGAVKGSSAVVHPFVVAVT